MIDESSYLTTHETALAVVATAMKKSRLQLDTLVVNLFMGGLLFSSGGMLYVLITSYCPETNESNPGFLLLLHGLVYPIGLFYVVVMGVDLFNLNVLFFLVGFARGAVSVLDLLISWFVSWWFNLVGTIFVCYIVCHYSNVTNTEQMIEGSRLILEEKADLAFHHTLIRGMAGNFFVCLAIYLQLMAKPLHVKFLMMLLPVFTFVAMGFSHSVADMYLTITGLINHDSVSVGTVAWKVFIPSTLGNIIGGSFFGLVIPWYLHLFVVERDRRRLHLPLYEMRDEQPELNQDSRVVRTNPREEEEEEMENELEEEKRLREEKGDLDSLDSSKLGTESQGPAPALYRPSTGRSVRSSASLRRKRSYRSPKNVFPVFGMESPSQRERSIAEGRDDTSDNDETEGFEDAPSAEYLGEQIRRTLSRRSKEKDIEAQPRRQSQSQGRLAQIRHPSQGSGQSVSTISIPRQLRSFSFAGQKKASRAELDELNSRLNKAGITERAANAANEAAGTADFYGHERSLPIHYIRSHSTVSPTTVENQERSATPSSSTTVQLYDPTGGRRRPDETS